jgi:hypothetical protein
MSSRYSCEENKRLSQRSCHLLTGFLSSTTKITLNNSHEEVVKVVPVKPHVIDVAKLVLEIFGPEGDDEEEEEVDYYQQSEQLLKYYETHCPRSMAIKAIRENQKYRCGEDYGAGDPCDNTDCFRDYTNNYFKRVLVEEDLYQTLCPDCISDDEKEEKEEKEEDHEEHKDKRTKIIVNNDL